MSIYYAENKEDYSQEFTFKFELEGDTSEYKELIALKSLFDVKWAIYHIGLDWREA